MNRPPLILHSSLFPDRQTNPDVCQAKRTASAAVRETAKDSDPTIQSWRPDHPFASQLSDGKSGSPNYYRNLRPTTLVPRPHLTVNSCCRFSGAGEAPEPVTGAAAERLTTTPPRLSHSSICSALPRWCWG